MIIRSALMIATMLTVVGCALLEDEEKILEGERYPVLNVKLRPQPDPDLAQEKIRLPRPYVNKAWPQAGGYPSHAMYHMAVSDSLAVDIEIDIGSGADSSQAELAPPVIADGAIFTLDTEAVVAAFVEASGKKVWQRELVEGNDEEDSLIGGALAYDSGYLIVAPGLDQVIALRARDGVILWTSEMDAPVRAAPTIQGERVFIVTVANRMVALGLRDGKRLWTHEAATQDTMIFGGASPASDGEIVVVTYSNGEVYALSVIDGNPQWSDSVAAVDPAKASSIIADIRALPIIDRDLVIVVGNSERMLALERSTGNPRWQHPFGGLQTPAVAGDYLFHLTNDNDLIAIRREDGKIRWTNSLPRYEDPEDEDGRILWFGPILVSNRLIVLGSHGEAWAISPYQGRALGAVDLADRVTTPPVAANGALYVVTRDASLTVYR